MIAKIVQTAKQMVKARVEIHNARCAFAGMASWDDVVICAP